MAKWKTMRAAVTNGRGDLAFATLPVPEPDEHQCLCRILACASCGTDLKIVDGTLPWKEPYPGILGHESVGRVVAVGKRVRHLAVGDIVFRPAAAYPGERLDEYWSLWGGFAEYGLVTDVDALREDRPDVVSNNYCRYQLPVPVDSGIDPADATLLITLKEVASSVANAGVKFGSSLVILGSGAVAMGMCFFAALYGAETIIVVGRRDEPLTRFRALGATHTVNARTEDTVSRIKEITGRRGAEVVLDTTGDDNLLLHAGRFLDLNGVLFPYAIGHTFTYRIDRAQGPETWRVCFTGPSEERAHKYVLSLARRGILAPSVFGSHRLPFDQLVEGFRLLRERTASKIVFEMAGD